MGLEKSFSSKPFRRRVDTIDLLSPPDMVFVHPLSGPAIENTLGDPLDDVMRGTIAVQSFRHAKSFGYHFGSGLLGTLLSFFRVGIHFLGRVGSSNTLFSKSLARNNVSTTPTGEREQRHEKSQIQKVRVDNQQPQRSKKGG